MDNQEPIDQSFKNDSVNRFYFIAIGFFVLTGVLVLRMFWIQVIAGGQYRELGRQQYEERLVLKANRGIIYDRNGVALVTNQTNYSVGIDPYMVGKDAQKIAKQFARVFGKSTGHYLNKIQEKSNFVWLERGIPEEKRKQLGDLTHPALVEVKEPSRLYRYNEKAGQLIGFTNVDNKGISGLELQYDSNIRGKDGWMMMQRDGLGRRIPTADYARLDPINGKNVTLTLDIITQSIVDEELKKGVEETGGIGGMAIFMIPQTGEIVAMSNYPDFNPNQADKLSAEDSRIKAITDVLEPGSTFKLVTAAAALETGVRKSTDKIFAENGRFRILDRVVVDHEPEGTITFAEGIIRSSNIVMAKTSKLIGEDRFYRYARNFGFGMETGIDLPGEIKGELKQPIDWSGVSLPWMSFGYEMLVTPLQMLNAYASVANNGVLMRPYVVKEIRDPNNEIIDSFEPQKIRDVIEQMTVDTLKMMFQGVVDKGTAKAARVDGLTIAGKTGTAQKNMAGQYAKKYMASFVGFFPVDRPILAGIVIIDSPSKGLYGGTVSAPVFGRVAQRVMGSSKTVENQYFANATIADTMKGMKIIPNIKGMSLEAAEIMLKDLKIEFDVDNDNGSYVIDVQPSVGSKIPEFSEVKIFTSSMKINPSLAKSDLPNVKGLSLRQAVNELQSKGYSVKVVGSGKVKSLQLTDTKSMKVLLVAEGGSVFN